MDAIVGEENENKRIFSGVKSGDFKYPKIKFPKFFAMKIEDKIMGSSRTVVMKLISAENYIDEKTTIVYRTAELENIIERQIILAKSNKINFDFLAKEQVPAKTKITSLPSGKLLNAEQQKILEKQNLENALNHCKGKIYGSDGAAALLGLPPTTLASKLKKFAIDKSLFS